MAALLTSTDPEKDRKRCSNTACFLLETCAWLSPVLTPGPCRGLWYANICEQHGQVYMVQNPWQLPKPCLREVELFDSALRRVEQELGASAPNPGYQKTR